DLYTCGSAGRIAGATLISRANRIAPSYTGTRSPSGGTANVRVSGYRTASNAAQFEPAIFQASGRKPVGAPAAYACHPAGSSRETPSPTRVPNPSERSVAVVEIRA